MSPRIPSCLTVELGIAIEDQYCNFSGKTNLKVGAKLPDPNLYTAGF